MCIRDRPSSFTSTLQIEEASEIDMADVHVALEAFGGNASTAEEVAAESKVEASSLV